MKSKTVNGCTLYLGDSYKILPKLNLKKYKRIALVTDPPYIVQSGGSKKKYFQGLHRANLAEGFSMNHIFILDNIDWKAIVCFCSKPQRYEVETFIRTIRDRNEDPDTVGWQFSKLYHRVELLFWDKINPAPNFNKCYITDKEFWIHAWQKGYHPVGGYDELRTHISTNVGGKSGHDHDTVKPYQVMRKAMMPLKGQFDLIIDPFMGSGTTGLVCQELGIPFIGIEKVEEYFEMAYERMENKLLL